MLAFLTASFCGWENCILLAASEKACLHYHYDLLVPGPYALLLGSASASVTPIDGASWRLPAAWNG
jgi:hypothetical protein